jgi:membrane protease YdiL (CAAX protease family)
MWQACLLPAMFFGVAHLWQGNDLMSIAGVVIITGLGGLLFGWLFVRWNFNLWPAVLLHIGMNSLWTVFALGENAIGSEMGNMLRLTTVLLAIILSLRMAPPKPL